MHYGNVPLARKSCHGQLIVFKEVIKNGTSNMKTEFVALVLFANVTTAIHGAMCECMNAQSVGSQSLKMHTPGRNGTTNCNGLLNVYNVKHWRTY